jgi:hypothetical protein
MLSTNAALVLCRCPYYRFAEEGLYGKLSSVNSSAAVDYWDQLSTAQLDSCDASFLQVTGLRTSM